MVGGQVLRGHDDLMQVALQQLRNDVSVQGGQGKICGANSNIVLIKFRKCKFRNDGITEQLLEVISREKITAKSYQLSNHQNRDFRGKI
jgi:hypothetical protein